MNVKKLIAVAVGLTTKALATAVAASAMSVRADGKTLTWNGADGAAWEGANWLEEDGETPSAWVAGANAVFPSAATVALSGAVTTSNMTISGSLVITGTVASAYSGFIGSSSAVLVFPGLTMDDIDGKSLSAEFQGGYLGGSGHIANATMHFWTRSGTTATAQFQAVYNNHLRCIKITFSEGADGIYAIASKNSYLVRSGNNGSSYFGKDIDVIDNVEVVVLATSASGTGLGICNIRRYNAEVVLTGSAPTSNGMYLTNVSFMVAAPMTNDITWTYGTGTLIAKGLSEAVETTYGKTGSESGEAAAWLTSSGNTLSNVMLSQAVPVRAVMRGKSIGVDNSCLPYHVKFDGKTMTLQFQFAAGSGSSAYIKGCKVELTQNGVNVTAKWIAAYYHVGGTLGEDLETASGVTKYTNASQYTSNGLKNMTFRLATAPALSMAANKLKCANVLIDNAQVELTGGNVYSTVGSVVVRNGSQVQLSYGTVGSSELGFGTVRRFESGSSLIAHKNLVALKLAHYIFDASTLYTPTQHGTWKDGCNYFNFLTLRNGARTIGYPLRCGRPTGAMTYRSEGTGTNRIESGICLYHGTAGSTLSVVTDADLEISGKIYDAPDNGNKHPAIEKSGDATLTLSCESTFTGRLTVSSGTLALGSNTALPASAPLTLAGGTVSCGATTNATGVLTLAGNATIDVGDGALSFADSHAATWAAGATLNITGNGRLPTRSIRFGTNNSGLTSAQLKQIRYNGNKVSLNTEGYLHGPKGLMIMVK